MLCIHLVLLRSILIVLQLLHVFILPIWGLLNQLTSIRHITLVAVDMIIRLQLFHLLMLPLRGRLPVPTLRSLQLLVLILLR